MASLAVRNGVLGKRLAAHLLRRATYYITPDQRNQNPIGAADAYKVINDMLDYFLSEMPVGERYLYFADALLGGLSAINWYFSWVDYLNTSDDTNVRVGLESLYDSILASPEFQIF